MRKSIAIVTSLVLLFALTTSSTIAYLQDTDSTVNVMTLGNVRIDQIELERKEQSDLNTAADNVQKYSNFIPLYPAVGEIAWADDNQNWSTGGSNQLFTDKLKNVKDKFVFVENTGKSDAYVRTFILLEAGALGFEEWDKMIHLNINNKHWQWSELAEDTTSVINGVTYYYYEAVYAGNAGDDGSEHKDGVLSAGQTTRPSLLQVFLDSAATNDTCEKLDGNGNGAFDIVVLCQAVQTAGFENASASSAAKNALDTAFNSANLSAADLGKKIAEWFAEEEITVPSTAPSLITNYDEMNYMLASGGDYALSSDIVATDMIYGYGAEASLNLNGNTIAAGNTNQYLFGAPPGSSLRLTGNGTVNAGKAFLASGGGEIIIDGGTYNTTTTSTLNNIKHTSLVQNDSKIVINGGTFTTNVPDAVLFFATSNAIVEVNGGFFENTANQTPDLFSMGTNKYNTNRIIFKGGTFVNWNPLEDRMCYTGEWPDSYEKFSGPHMLVWDGYKVVSETKANGDVWYSVVPK